jgi:sugar O-acyltransferase (sialic acid O-acetyltransferase NeuD family)
VGQDLIIIGAGGSSREIAWAVEDINRSEEHWNLLGFLDDDPAKQGVVIDGFRVLGGISSVQRYSSSQFVIGVANSDNRWVRKQLVDRMELEAERFATIIHPTASVSKHSRVGVGTVILHNAVITPGSMIGNHVIISRGVSVGHDGWVEDFVTIASGAINSGHVRIGAGAYVGAGSSILPKLTVGAGALVGIGSVVLRDVAPNIMVLGNPARPISKI